MGEEENVALVRRFTEAFEERDFERVRAALLVEDNWEELAASLGEFGDIALEVVDPDIVVDVTRYPWVDRTIFEGLDGWLDFWRSWLEPWEDFTYTQSNWEELGDDVLLDLVITARGRESGAPVELRACEHFRVRDSRIVRMSLFETRDQALAALGHD